MGPATGSRLFSPVKTWRIKPNGHIFLGGRITDSADKVSGRRDGLTRCEEVVQFRLRPELNVEPAAVDVAQNDGVWLGWFDRHN